VNGDRKRCLKCQREINWLNIASFALDQVHSLTLIALIILGEQKLVNTEAPHAIAGLQCFKCKMPFENLRNFKCHNWAYAKEALLRTL
jgi:hypothetical protein